MTVGEAIQLLEETKIGFSAKQGFLKGLQILAKYDEDVIPEFDHDICWASTFESTVQKMSKAEIIQMKKEFGWDYDEENECWSHG